jgi:hypothetical protein
MGICDSHVVASQIQPWTRITVRESLPVDDQLIAMPSTEAVERDASLLAPV